MYFHGDGYVPLPNKDIVSWIFDDPKYDVDKPVSPISGENSNSLADTSSRSISMPPTRRDLSHIGRHALLSVKS